MAEEGATATRIRAIAVALAAKGANGASPPMRSAKKANGGQKGQKSEFLFCRASGLILLCFLRGRLQNRHLLGRRPRDATQQQWLECMKPPREREVRASGAECIDNVIAYSVIRPTDYAARTTKGRHTPSFDAEPGRTERDNLTKSPRLWIMVHMEGEDGLKSLEQLPH